MGPPGQFLTSLDSSGITIPFGYAAKAPAVRGPFEEDVMPKELFTCGVKGCEHDAGWWYGYRLEAKGKENV